MNVTQAADLTARQKAAIVVMSLGPKASGVLEQLGGGEVEQLAEEIVQLGDIPQHVRDEVLTEFQNRLAASQSTTEGGVQQASALLEARLGKEQAEDALSRLAWKSNEALHTFAHRSPEKLAELLAPEHPQTIAFVITQLPPDSSATVLTTLEDDLRADVVWRVATMDDISPLAAAAVHRALSRRLRRMTTSQRREQMGGEDKAAGLMNMASGEIQKFVFDDLAQRDPELAARVRKLMFVFKDVLLLDDRSMQRVLKDIENKDLIVALKNADDVIRQRFFKNMSERAAVSIQEEIEYLGQVKASDVEQAQDNIIERIRALEENGEIIINRGGRA